MYIIYIGNKMKNKEITLREKKKIPLREKQKNAIL